MTDEEHIRRGIQVLEEMAGKEEADRVRAAWRKLCPDFEGFVLGFLAGQVWTRGHLDLKTRSLCTVAALTALGRVSGLELNIKMARGNGASREEIVEVMLQMAGYAGFPAAWEGLKAAAAVFEEEG